MEFDWYNLFSLPEFLATDLVSKKLNVVLEARGETEILITRGNTVALNIGGVFLPVSFEDRNPYIYPGDTHAVFLDEDENVWLGFAIEEQEV